MINWAEIIKELGIVGLITSAIGWLVKTLSEHVMNKSFKSFEKELAVKADIYKAELDKDLETFKKDLNFDLTKRERLHQRRLDILGELYKKIVDLDFAMLELTAIFKRVAKDFDEEEKKRIEKAGNAYNEFLQYYKVNKIYFRYETCKILDNLVAGYFDALWDYTFEKRMGTPDPELAKKAYEKMQTEVPKVKEQIESDFRKYFGEDESV
jgi:hypothetical protein